MRANGFYNNVALYANGTRRSFSPSVSADNRTLVLSGFTLPTGSLVAVVVTRGVTDLAGNALVDFTSLFATAPAFDTRRATVTSQRPGNGATGVGLTSPLVLFVNEPLRAATVPGALHVSQNGQLVAGTVTLTSNGQTIEFVPTAPWAYGALMQVFLDATATDVNGTTVTAIRARLRTVADPATTAPAVVALTPFERGGRGAAQRGGGDWVQRAAECGDGDGRQRAVAGPVNPVPATLTLDATGTVIRLVPTAALAPNTSYCYYVLTQTVLGTNGLPAPSVAQCFTTGTSLQTTAPTVVAVSPADQLANVPVNTNVRVVFSGPIDPLTVTGDDDPAPGGRAAGGRGDQLQQRQSDGAADAAGGAAGWTPMTLTIAGVQDGAGNLVPPTTTQFTTSSVPATAPPVGSQYQSGDTTATNVPVNVAVAVQTNAVMDLTTVTAAHVARCAGQHDEPERGGHVCRSVRTATTIYFLPSAPLATGRTLHAST